MGSEEVTAIRRKTVGALLRQAHLAVKRAREDCSEVRGCSVDRISQYEYGQRDVSQPAPEVLADLLVVPIAHSLDEGLIRPPGVARSRIS